MVILTSAGHAADEWGDVAVRFVYDANKLPVREDLVVNPRDNGIANIVISLQKQPGDVIRVHPDLKKPARGVPLTIVGRQFVPRVLVMQSGQTLEVANGDAHAYNIRAEFFDNPSVNTLVRAEEAFSLLFRRAESSPTRLQCSIHAELNGYLFVRDDPYGAVSDESGKIKLAKLPTGKRTLVVWHERCGYVKKATVAGKEVEWLRGREVEIKPGKNDLGDVLVKPEVFKE